MNPARWEPFVSMDALGRFSLPFRRWPALANLTSAEHEWSPSVDISETEGEYVIRAVLPAVRKEDIKVTVQDGLLTLSGERQQQQEQKAEKPHTVETFYGSFSRSFMLPNAIDSDNIRAEAKDGVVTIHLPKSKAEVKPATAIKVQ